MEETFRAVASREPPLPIFHCGLALIYRELERPDDARRGLEQIAVLGGARPPAGGEAHDFAGLPRDGLWLIALSFAADVCAYLGDAERARLLYALLQPYADRNTTNGFYAAASHGALARCLGLLAATLGQWEDAERHFESALVMNTRMGALPWVAYTHVDHARVLLDAAAADRPDASAQQARAREHVASAIGIAEPLGMGWLCERAARLATGAAPVLIPAPASVSVTTPAPAGLTPREVEVLRLVAAGKSNREIAGVLMISLFTAVRHVSNILTKIGAANRAEASSYAARHGLL